MLLDHRVNFGKIRCKYLIVFLNNFLFFQLKADCDAHITINNLLVGVDIVILGLNIANFEINFGSCVIGYSQLWVYQYGLRIFILEHDFPSTEKKIVKYRSHFLRTCRNSAHGFRWSGGWEIFFEILKAAHIIKYLYFKI